jgi:hypothetical protein
LAKSAAIACPCGETSAALIAASDEKVKVAIK